MMNANTIKWAIQKNGRLTEKSLDIINQLHKSSITIGDFTELEYRYFPEHDIAVYLVRDDDIPFLVSVGCCSVGVASEVVREDAGYENLLTIKLNFLKCKLVHAVSSDDTHKNENVLVTKFTNIAKNIFDNKFVIYKLHGGVELSGQLGIAKNILEITQSGKSLKKHNYEIVETFKEYDTEVIVNQNQEGFYKTVLLYLTKVN